MNFNLLLEKYRTEYLKLIKPPFNFRKLQLYQKVVLILVVIDLVPLLILNFRISNIREKIFTIYLLLIVFLLIIFFAYFVLDSRPKNRSMRLEKMAHSATERQEKFIYFLEQCNIPICKENLILLKEYCSAELVRDKEHSFTQSLRSMFTCITPIITFFVGIYAERQEDIVVLLEQSIHLIGIILSIGFLRAAYIVTSNPLQRKRLALDTLINDIDQTLIFKILITKK